MADSGILDGLEAVAGSSAGAITAAVIATGISKEMLRDYLRRQIYQTYLAKDLS